MKTLQILGAVLLCGAVGCQSQSAHVHDHWSPRFIGPSMSRAFFTYDAETDGSYIDFQWRKKQSINMTVRRHVLNHNPENPFQTYDASVYEPRPVHSVVPRPWNYIHLEGVAFGAVTLVGGGMFFPIPVDSIMGTAEEGGKEEFMEGVNMTTRPIGVVTCSFLHDALRFPETKGTAWRD